MDLIAISILAVTVIAATIYQNKRQLDSAQGDYRKATETLLQFNSKLNTQNQKLLENYFKSLKLQEEKQVQILEKQSAKYIEMLKQSSTDKETKLQEELNKFSPKTRNDISREEVEEIPLTEDYRIPIVDGLKVKFEGEEEIFPNNYEA